MHAEDDCRHGDCLNANNERDAASAMPSAKRAKLTSTAETEVIDVTI
jgi:hypothetical protein